MTLGSGIAVAGMWIAVAAVGWQSPFAGVIFGLCAIAGAVAIAGSDA